MDIITYLLIAVCYITGCVLSYRQGVTNGTEYTLHETIRIVAKLSNATELQIVQAIQEYRKQALKATRS
jgi:hypothetical protein